jgi:hypothetical protein
VKDYLLARKRLLAALLAVSTLVGLGAAYVNGGDGASQMQIATATTHVLVDRPDPPLVERPFTPADFEGATRRAEMFSRVMASNQLETWIARAMRLPNGSVGAFARTTAQVPHALTEPDLEERAATIEESRRQYRIELQSRPTEPVIDVYTQAPSTEEAVRLANTAVDGLRAYVRDLGAQSGIAASDTPRIEQLGPPRGGVINSRVPAAIALLTFIVTFALTASGLLGLIALRVRKQNPPADEGLAEAWTDDWPRTNRLLPWMVAGFLVLLWLVPFDRIQLSFSTPIDLKLDRLVLPFIFAIWVVAFAAGSRMAPRMRFTGIHLAVAAFVGCAFLSVVVNAGVLNHTLEIDQSFKRLPLLVAYVSLFFIAASVVRPGEVRAFLTFTLWLAVLCALGIVWEYRMGYNVFVGLSDMVLPGIFTVAATTDGTYVDGIGRLSIAGPASLGLEAVAMLSMALPIAFVWLMKAKTRGKQVLYGLVTCLLFAAIIATFRKSAILVPASVIGTLAYFRRRELLRFSPLGLVLVVVIHVASPGALGSTFQQFQSSRLGAATVNDRAIDYDAVRPELWTHLLLGKGWGSYDRVNYRVLDTEILQRIIETGLIGLGLFLLMPLAVVFCARKLIADRDDPRAPLALIGAAAAIAFAVASTLFDILSFPHSTYIFLYMAGLVAVIVRARRGPAPPQPQPQPQPGVRPRRAADTHVPDRRREPAVVGTEALR